MERKEFNSIDEAIEALNDIANIDYSTNVDEITQREFYSRLMNNFMGIKNINLTKEDREKYRAALSKKGLLKYSDWKSMQPANDEQVTWKNSVENGSLDAPVNLFSKLLEADDEKKFDYIKDVISNEEKSDIGEAWLEKNSEILEDLENTIDDNTESILSDTENDLSKFVEEILNEKEENKKEKSKEEQKPIKSELKKEIKKEEEEPVKFADKFGSFETPEEAIEALKAIDKIEYKKGKEPNRIAEKEFYNNIMKNLIASSKLNFTDDQAYKYKQALESIGCKQRGKLNKLRKVDEDIEIPVDIVSSILQSTRADHYQNLKTQKAKVRTDEDVKEWVEKADEAISVKDYEKNLEKELNGILGRDEKNLPVEVKKPGFFKKLGTRVAMVAAAVSTLFNVASTVAKAAEDDANIKNGMSESVGGDVIKEAVKTGVKQNIQNPVRVKAEIPGLDEFTIELQANVNGNGVRAVDQAYTQTPDDHNAITSAANEKAFAQVATDNTAAANAAKAKDEVASKDINNNYEKSDEAKASDENKNTSDTVVVNADGSTGGEGTSGEENREHIDLGVIAFSAFEAYTDDSSGSFVEYDDENTDVQEDLEEEEEKKVDDDDLTI